MTQKQVLLNHLKDQVSWIPSYDLQKVNTRWGWLGTSADREARRMAEEGVIERKREGKYTYYRAKVKPFGERKFVEKKVLQAVGQDTLL